MNDKITKYLNGSVVAEDLLIDEIMEIYGFDLTIEEAKLLLRKKYGNPEIF